MILQTRRLPGSAFDRIASSGHDYVVGPPSGMTRQELLSRVPGASAIISTLADTIDGEVMDAAGGGLKVIANYAVGFNNIDVEEATRRGIVVCNTPDVLTDATADMAFAMVMAAARFIPQAHEFTKKGLFTGWDPELFLGQPVWGKTMGIVGMGKIGTAVARRAKGFGMTILYHNRKPVPAELEAELEARLVPLDVLLRESDFVVLLTPLTEETRGMIGERELSLMKGSACLVNISRGPVVVEDALVRALKEKKIFAAALDVYEREPEIHPGLFELDNAVLLPHIGSATAEAREKMAHLTVENVLSVLDGREPPASVNYREVFSSKSS
ncbi:MAG: D-glycerate dehydrogenase [Deltaproteobacteria bacterium]|nr:MAG: D-glycerate dehydrogenase [Deltaproteobacteria bacterium]